MGWSDLDLNATMASLDLNDDNAILASSENSQPSENLVIALAQWLGFGEAVEEEDAGEKEDIESYEAFTDNKGAKGVVQLTMWWIIGLAHHAQRLR